MEHAPDAHQPDPPPPAVALALLRGVGCVLAFILVQGVGFGIVQQVHGSISTAGGLALDGALAFSAIQALGIIAVASLIHVGVSSWRRLGMLASRAQVRAGLRALAPVGLLVTLPTFLYVLASGDRVIAEGIDLPLGAALVLLAILIAVNEELWFRGLLLQGLGAPARPWLVVLAGALLFGLPHAAASPASWLNAAAVTLAVGIPFAVVRLTCTALLPLIVWHAIIDTWAFLHTASVIPVGDPTLADAMVALTMPALIAVCYLVWMRGRMRRQPAANPS